MESTKKSLSFSNWLLAARPKTLTAAFVPVAVGTALSHKSLAEMDWVIAGCALMVAMCIQIATNFVNDALDFKKGADTSERIGPMRVTQAGLLSAPHVLAAGVALFFISLLFGIPLIIKGGWSIALLLALSVACGYLYTGGPFPLAYHGLGDLFVFLFFGVFSTSAVFFLQEKTFSWRAVIAGAEIGMLAAVIIAINNLRDIAQDKKANKKTLAVRLGIDKSKVQILTFLFAPFIINLVWIFWGHPLAALLPLAALPIAIKLAKHVLEHSPSSIYNQFLAEAAFTQLLFSVLFVIGFRL